MIRLAVIGGGPKALFALLALHDRLTPTAAAALTVDVYDPLPPGSGSVWRLDQPDILRLNVNAGIVDASSSINGENFTGWVGRTAPHMAGEKYPPRALVGRYLREHFTLLSRHGHFPVTHVPHAVTGLDRDDSQWRASGEFGAQHYDEVLLATGHGLATAALGDPLSGALNGQPLIGDYAALTGADITPDATVWVRGAALTAYDVALLLTEGRGGTWQQPMGADEAGLRYVPAGREPRRIILSSRSGTLMDPKSESVPASIGDCIEHYKEQLRLWGAAARNGTFDGGAGLAGLWPVLLRCAQECARLVGADVCALSLWRTALTGRSVAAGDHSTPGPLSPAQRLKNSLAVNHRQAPVTTGWLWARVWSGLYAELVAAVDRLPRSTRQWRHFARVAGNLEKFTFGPPELTARKLVALFDAGILHQAEVGEAPPSDAVLIDAVTPGPGVLRAAAPEGSPSSDLFAGLLHAGRVSIRAGDRGLLTDPDGTCLARDGSKTTSLAALGRPTEDPTLGHDTLNRSLHGEYWQWARRIAARVTHELDTVNPTPMNLTL